MKYYDVSGRAYLLMFSVAVPLYIVFSYNSQTVKGFVSAVLVCGLIAIISILRDLSNSKTFWLAILFIALLHIVLIALVPMGDELYFGFLALPLVVADMYASARFIIWLTQSR